MLEIVIFMVFCSLVCFTTVWFVNRYAPSLKDELRTEFKYKVFLEAFILVLIAYALTFLFIKSQLFWAR